MEKLRTVFENISGGFVMAGKAHGEMIFSRVSVEEYIRCLDEYKPDILSLSEVHMENENGCSEMAASISEALKLPNYRCFAQSRSHLDTSKHLGIAVLSKYPIIDSDPFLLPNPRLEVKRPDGSNWIMFDKGAQRLMLDVHGRRVQIINLHYFPFHHFHRQMNEDEFSGIRQALVDILLSKKNLPTIITGDFNNKGLPLPEAFPELFEQGRFCEAVTAQTTVVGLQDQFDHILYTSHALRVVRGFAARNLSDHYAVIADFSLIISK